jgi:hypothetical protein
LKDDKEMVFLLLDGEEAMNEFFTNASHVQILYQMVWHKPQDMPTSAEISRTVNCLFSRIKSHSHTHTHTHTSQNHNFYLLSHPESGSSLTKVSPS